MARISFDVDLESLRNTRRIRLRQGKNRYALPFEPVYQGIAQFLISNKNGYRFALIDVLHAAAVKMLGAPSITRRKITLFATGGLYLTLDLAHPDLGIRDTFGDFTSGFSHLFGVAFAVMIASEAYQLPWDSLVPIPVAKKRSMDYETELTTGAGWLKLEAKGVTSETSLSNARRNAYSKKLKDPNNIRSGKRVYPTPTAMVGVITQAARKQGERGTIEIMDPAFQDQPANRARNNQMAGKYFHYAGVARFAGLLNVANELASRAESLVHGQEHFFRSRKVEFDDRASFEVHDHRLVGVQWRLSESRNADSDIWLFHAVDTKRFQVLLTENEFLPTRPYHLSEPAESELLAESILPDGSYFGIGTKQQDGLAMIDPRETDLGRLSLARIY